MSCHSSLEVSKFLAAAALRHQHTCFGIGTFFPIPQRLIREKEERLIWKFNSLNLKSDDVIKVNSDYKQSTRVSMYEVLISLVPQAVLKLGTTHILITDWFFLVME